MAAPSAVGCRAPGGDNLLEVIVLDGELVFHVFGRAGRHVLVHGRCLVVPADAQAAIVRQDNGKVHAQDAAGARLVRQVRLALLGVFLGHDQLEQQRVGDLGAVPGLGVTGVLEHVGVWLELVDAEVELHVDDAVGAGVVRLPALVEALLADDAGLAARQPLVGRLGEARVVALAGGGDGLDGLLQLPGQLLELPQVDRLDALVVRHQAVELERHLVVAGGVDDGHVAGRGLDVGGREDADGVVRVQRLGQGSLDVDEALKLGARDGAHALRGGGSREELRLGMQHVRDGDDGRVHGGWQMARQQDGEGELVLAPSQGDGVCQEIQLLQLGRLGLAVAAVVLEGPLVVDDEVEAGVEGLDVDQVLLDVQEELARDQGTGALLGVAVEDNRRALDVPVNHHGRVGSVVMALLGGRPAKVQRQTVVLPDGFCEVGHLDGMAVFAVRGMGAGVARGTPRVAPRSISRPRDGLDVGDGPCRATQQARDEVGHDGEAGRRAMIAYRWSGGDENVTCRERKCRLFIVFFPMPNSLVLVLLCLFSFVSVNPPF